jgi:hypothetical protein
MAQVDSENSTAVPAKPIAEAAENPADALYFPTDTTPEELFQRIGNLRKEARDEINRLIGFLDKTDDYVSRELEDSIDDNPHDEETDDNEEDSEEADPAEYSLGSLDHQLDQSCLSDGLGKDLEDEHDGAEPDEDGEPSLGSFEGHDDQVPFRDWANVGMV